ncbi:MAG: hypothetical protein KZQ73_09350 [Candidatus Thiodiazotropha sp. (ex Semelilucina semeliformis)]|nr:hypothetical protein [Candidatus Thiodiazotropha sp. (ex Semelilucina semeliformis)]
MKKLALSCLTLFPFACNAGWSQGWGTVTQVISHNGQHIIYTTIPDALRNSNGKFWWPSDDSDAKDMYSMALAAFMGGKELSVAYNENTPEWLYNNIAKATHMKIR